MCKFGLHLRQPRLGPDRVADVANGFGGSEYVTGCVAYRRNRNRHRDFRSVLMAAHGAKMLDAASGAQLRDDFVFLSKTVLGNEQRYVLPDRLASLIAEDALRRDVPAHDDAVERLADDGFIGRLHDLCEQPVGILAQRDLRFEQSQVTDDADEDAAAAKLALPHRKIHGEGRAVLAAARHLAADTDDPPLACPIIVRQVLIMFVMVRSGHQQFDVFGRGLQQADSQTSLRTRR